MSFYPRRRRTAPGIIIISLIDVLIVMLVFLLVTSTFRNQPAVKLSLPDVGDALKTGAGEAKPPLIVSIARTTPAEPTYYVGSRPVTPDQLLAEFKTAARNDPQTRLILRADREASWEQVARVMSFARQANLTAVRAFTKQGP